MKKKRIVAMFLSVILLLPTLVGCSKVDKDTAKTNSFEINFDATQVVKTLFTNMTKDESKGRLAGTKENIDIGNQIADYYKNIGLAPFKDQSYFHEYTAPIFNNRDADETQLKLIIGDEEITLLFGEDYMINNTLEDISTTLTVTDDNNIDKSKQKNYLCITDTLTAFDKNKNLFAGSITIRESEPQSTNAPYGTENLNIKMSKELHKKIKSNIATGEKVQLSIDVKKNVKTENLQNIAGKIDGQSSEKALFITAHFDGIGYINEKVFNGAMDNASGTATMLMVADIITNKYKGGLTPSYDIYFVAFNSEEIGLTGSKAFATDMYSLYGENIININLDCITTTLTLGTDDKSVEPLIKDLRMSLEQDGISCKDEQYINSDHYSFSNNGATALTIGDIDGSTYDLMHTTKDTADLVDITYCEKVASSLSAYCIRKGGKIFDLCTTETDTIDWEKLNNTAKSKLQNISLKSNEYYDFYDEEQDIYVRLTGQKNYINIDEFAKVFPKEKVSVENIPPTLNGLKFYSVQAYTKTLQGSSRIITKDQVEKLDTIIKLDMSTEPIEMLSIAYGVPSEDKSVEAVLVRITPNSSTLQPSESEIATISDKEYQLVHSSTMVGSSPVFDPDSYNQYRYNTKDHTIEIKFSEAYLFEDIVAEASEPIKLSKEKLIELIEKLDKDIDVIANIMQ